MIRRAGLVMILRKITTITRLNANHYEVLGVKPTATAMEIKMAYYEKTKLYHPDKASATKENLRNFRLISEAYEILGNASSRKFYNENVLGLTVKSNNEEDLFNNYVASKMRNSQQLDQWTKNHLDYLRNDHFLGKQQAMKQSMNKPNKSMESPFFFYVLISFCVLFYYVAIQKNGKEKHGNI